MSRSGTLIRYDRVGEAIEVADDDVPAEAAPAGPARCARGAVLAADGSCCVWHDTRPHLQRH